MSDRLTPCEAKFQAIAEEAVEEARRVKCSIADFVLGLEMIRVTLQEEIDAANECDAGDVEPV